MFVDVERPPHWHGLAASPFSMADRLARVYGTEDDKVNCSYYHKVGACRHGAVCGRKHNTPLLSQTLLLKHVWANPAVNLGGDRQSPEQLAAVDRSFSDTYIDIFDEMSRFGEIEEVHVCENLCDHLVRRARARASFSSAFARRTLRAPRSALTLLSTPPPAAGRKRVCKVF
jgi:hypothetical protein